jgi:hypothetical protein
MPFDGMLTRGLNASGLAFTYAYVEEDCVESMSPQRWGGELLSTCATAREALDWLAQRRGELLAGNYLIGDAEGTAMAVEVSARAVRPRAIDGGGALVCSNRWEEQRNPSRRVRGLATAQERYDRGCQLLATRPGSLAELLRLVRDHADPVGDAERDYGTSVCNHGRVEGTISAEAFDVRRRWLWYAFGWPCGERHGHEASERSPWGRFAAFAVDRIDPRDEDLCLVTTDAGVVTALGMRLLVAIEPRP